MSDHNAILLNKFNEMGALIEQGAHPIDRPFRLDSSDPSSPSGTFWQLCQALGYEAQYRFIERVVAAGGIKAVRRYKTTDDQRAKNRERQRRYRQNHPEKFAPQAKAFADVTPVGIVTKPAQPRIIRPHDEAEGTALMLSSSRRI